MAYGFKPQPLPSLDECRQLLSRLSSEHEPLDEKARAEIEALEAQKAEPQAELDRVAAQHRAVSAAIALCLEDYQERHSAWVEIASAKALRQLEAEDEFEASSTPEQRHAVGLQRFAEGAKWPKPQDWSTAWYQNAAPELGPLELFLSSRRRSYEAPIAKIQERIDAIRNKIRARADERDRAADAVAEAERKQKADDARILEALTRSGMKLVPASEVAP